MELVNKKKWDSLLECKTKSEFFETAASVSARDYVLNHERLEYFANKKFKVEHVREEYPLVPFIIPQELTDWVTNEFNGTHRRRKSLVLWGPSRMGKTEWARSLGKHMYFNNVANFKDKWDDEADYIIFDDFNLDFIPNRKGFFGGQEEFEITGKYMKVKSVRWGKVCIYLCNNVPNYGNDEQWFRANIIEFNVFNKLY